MELYCMGKNLSGFTPVHSAVTGQVKCYPPTSRCLVVQVGTAWAKPSQASVTPVHSAVTGPFECYSYLTAQASPHPHALTLTTKVAGKAIQTEKRKAG